MPALHDRFRSLAMLVHVPVAIVIVRPRSRVDWMLLGLGFLYAYLVERLARQVYEHDLQVIDSKVWKDVEARARAARLRKTGHDGAASGHSR